jgi:CheY-like chemotaxis protein
MIVDDNSVVRDVLGSIMRDEGHQTSLAADGTDALQQCSASLPDVVVTDIFMPRMDGIDLIRALRRDFPGAKIIAISAGWKVPNLEVGEDHADRDMLVTARKAGADRTLMKPLDPARLVAAVADLLSPERARRSA